MKITYHANYDQLSRFAKTMIIAALHQKQTLLLCAATGNSPLKTYQLLGEEFVKNTTLFKKLRVIKLDEWGGVAMQEPQTCEHFLQKNLLKPLQIDKNQYFAFESKPSDSKAECERMQNVIKKEGPIDICVLGLGRNGHIGFNEPADLLHPYAHIAKLSATSLQHDMVQSMLQKPTYGMTLGMSDILHSKKIILLITGNNKKEMLQRLLEQKITTQLPASLLWLHPDVECLINENVMKV